MLSDLIYLVGMDLAEFHIDSNILFVVCSAIVLYCLGFMFNFFQALMERLTSKKGR